MKTVYIILAFCAGLFLGHLLFPSQREIKPPVYAQLNEQKERIAKIDQDFISHQSVFKKQNDSLLKEIKNYKALLASGKANLVQKRDRTFALLNRIKQDTVYHCDSALVDSLSTQIAAVNLSTDSLISSFEKQSCFMEELLATKDSQIVICGNAYLEIKSLAQEQALREQKLQDDLNTALKQQTRTRVQNKILAAGMLFVSGITTTLFIKSRQ